jgi:hypothetical protein
VTSVALSIRLRTSANVPLVTSSVRSGVSISIRHEARVTRYAANVPTVPVTTASQPAATTSSTAARNPARSEAK